jgi:hypothetical protein
LGTEKGEKQKPKKKQMTMFLRTKALVLSRIIFLDADMPHAFGSEILLHPNSMTGSSIKSKKKK